VISVLVKSVIIADFVGKWMQEIEKMSEFKKCHRLGHRIKYGLDPKSNHVQLCVRCGTVWKRGWIKDLNLTKKIVSGKIDIRKYDEIPIEQIIRHEQDLGQRGKEK